MCSVEQALGPQQLVVQNNEDTLFWEVETCRGLSCGFGQGERCVCQPDHPALGTGCRSGSQGFRGRRARPGILADEVGMLFPIPLGQASAGTGARGPFLTTVFLVRWTSTMR